MALVVNTNVAAMDAYRNLQKSSAAMNDSLAKLSSGSRINKAADDAAGLAISTGLQSQINGMTQAVKNAQDGINVVQTADGALTETTSILQRMRTLAVQASNSGSMDSTAIAATNQEFNQLQNELDRITSATKFGTQQLLGGSYTGSFTVGSDLTTGNVITVDLSTAGLTGSGGPLSGAAWTGAGTTYNNENTTATAVTGLDASGLAVDSAALTGGASDANAIGNLDRAIDAVSSVRANLGAYQNRFQHTVNSLNVAIQNATASNSQIADTDMASEMSNFTKNQILVQAGTAMLAQANQANQGILKLLG
jgi:flagellin